jgi:hypothetical protein
MCTALTDFMPLSEIRLSSYMEMDSYVLVKEVLYPMSCHLMISHRSSREVPYFSRNESLLKKDKQWFDEICSELLDKKARSQTAVVRGS